MNKLDVAIRLLQLLNDRKSVNSKIIADELNVSLRTAQRYLLELSILPCVVNVDNNHTYSLDSNYKLSEALLNGNRTNHTEVHTVSSKVTSTNQMVCLVCGQKRKLNTTAPWACSGNNIFLSNQAIDRLATIIKKKLEGNRGKFP